MYDARTGLIWIALLTALAGAAITWACAPRIIEMLLQTLGPRVNYRRRPTSFPAGLALILGAVGGPVVAMVVSPQAWAGPLWPARAASLILTLGFGLAGLVDDLLGGHDHSGFRGHLGAMRRGVVTTGVFKIAVGVVISVGAVSVLKTATWAAGAIAPARVSVLSLAQLALDSALIAASANLINLLDRRPGRAIKGFLLGAAGAVVWTVLSRGADVAFQAVASCAGVVGSAIAILPLDLGEQAMLGDTGSNPLGAALGLLLLYLAPGARIVLLALAIWLTLTSERVSFSQAIDSNKVLRFLDRMGRKDP
ncbi:MAG TPA: hypothetical protein PKM09_03875 [Bacillota bacterium]|nr:hypothetical protein [Bacillota bacterium]HNY67836.1 hypothetical protein [Bacillota bacterium]HOI37298.1 hypothetical protein [Bacillota bacterium]